MPSYTAAEKGNALRLCDEIGVCKASEETGITVHTLYTWRRAKGGTKPTVAPNESKGHNGHGRKQEVVKEPTVREELENESLICLRTENDSLKAQIATLKRALRAFSE